MRSVVVQSHATALITIIIMHRGADQALRQHKYVSVRYER